MPKTEQVPTSLGRWHVQIEGDGPPAILWHSLFVDSTSWELVRGALARHRRLVIIDGPAHGGSGPAPHLFSVDACAAAAIELLKHLDIDTPVDWVGNAWGGHVGLSFAGTTPDRCRSLVTIGTPVQALSVAERLLQILPLVGAYRLAGPIEPVRAALTNALLGAGVVAAQPALAERVIAAFSNAERLPMYGAMRSVMLRRPDLTERLSTIAAPTVMFAAADHSMWNPALARSAAAAMPTATAIAVQGSGHVSPLLLTPELLHDSIIEFWADPAGFVQRARGGHPNE